MDRAPLPDFERPPVVEEVLAVQFAPLPQFGMPEVVAVSRAFDGWKIVDTPPALTPIVELPAGRPATASINLGLGNPPIRLLLQSLDGKWLFQAQQDRIAVHELANGGRPSFQHVAPRLAEMAAQASQALGREVLSGEHKPELVELIYENRIPAVDVWSSFRELHRVVRFVSETPAEPPYDALEAVTFEYSVVLEDRGEFVGRLRVLGVPAVDEDGTPVLNLRVFSRRYVRGRNLDEVMEDCHVDIVQGFTAITTPEMHEAWGRFR